MNLEKNNKRTLKIAPNSEGEKYFIKDIMPLCKDNVTKIYSNQDYNEYEISNNDYYRVKNALQKRNK